MFIFRFFSSWIRKARSCLFSTSVLPAAIDSGVKQVICLSTDKAAYPVNAMGASKALMEKVFIARARTVSPDRTLICGTRYGNVMCSRGSVIPLFIEQIKAGKPLTVTNPNMTRFMMSLEEAVDLVLFTFVHAQSGDIMVQKAPACTIGIDVYKRQPKCKAVLRVPKGRGKIQITCTKCKHEFIKKT